MRITFTTNEKFWSRVARFLSKEDETHLGIIFEDYNFALAFDCSTSGFKVQNLSRFFTVNKEIESIKIPMNEREEALVMSGLLHSCVGKPYDFDAYAWMILCRIKRRFFGIKKPRFNPWQEPEKYLCTEILNPLKETLAIHGINLYRYDLAAMTPREIFRVMETQLDAHNKIR